MSYKSLGLLAVALFCGVVCSFLVKLALLDPTPKELVISPDETTQIIVALNDLPVGTEISPQRVKFAQYPKDKVPREAITGFSGIDKRRITRPVRANTPISLYDLELEPEVAPERLTFIPPGYTVVPVQIDSISSSGGISELTPFVRPEELLTPGDKVTVSLVYEESLNNPWERSSKDDQLHRLVTKTLLEEVEVYDSSLQRATTQEQGRNDVAVVSLLLNQENAAMVKSVVKSGKLRLVPGNRKIEETGTVVADTTDQEVATVAFPLANLLLPATSNSPAGNSDKTAVEPALVAQTSASEVAAIQTAVSTGAGNATFLSDRPSKNNGATETNDPERAVPVTPLPPVQNEPARNKLGGSALESDSVPSSKPEGAISPTDSRPKTVPNRPLLPTTAPRSPVDYSMVNKKEAVQ